MKKIQLDTFMDFRISDIPPISNFEVCSHDPYSEKGFEEMWNVSPLKYVKNAKTPTLIIHRIPGSAGVL